jgi:uncharacterized Zn-finger protein
MSHDVLCPRCGRKQYFTCIELNCTCWAALPRDINPQIHLPDNKVACPYCGFTESFKFWCELEEQSYNAERESEKKITNRGLKDRERKLAN